MGLLLSTPSRAVDLDVLIGFGQSTSSRALYRPDTPTPLTVYLTGSGIKGEGQLQVTVRSNDRTTTYSRKISLREGPIKEAHAESFVFQLHPIDYMMGRNSMTTEINVQLLVDGRQVAHKSVSMPLSTSADSYNVLALTKFGSGLNFLQKKKMGLFHRFTNSEEVINNRTANGNTPANGINPNASLFVSYTRTDAMPTMLQGYDMMDAIALADMPIDNLTDSQIAALKGFVRSGGLLIISGGGDLSRLKSQFYQEMLPINVSGSENVNDVPELAARYRTPLGLASPVAMLRGSLKPGASVFFGPKNNPIVTGMPYGAGTVLLTAFDYIDPSFRGWQAAPSLWRDLLRCGNDEVEARGVLAAASRTGAGSNTLADALAGKSATNTPEFYTIAIFLGAYIVLLIPVSYFVLKRMDRRELAWYTAPALIVGFTVVSYVIALTIKGGALNVNRVVVAESQAGSDQFAGYGQITLYSPRRSTYDIGISGLGDNEIAGRDVSPNEIYRGQVLSSDTTVEQDGKTILRNTQIGLWDKRSFDAPVAVNMGGRVDAAVKMIDGAQAEVTVTNHTKYAFKDCAIVDGDQPSPMGDLAPGQSAKATVKWAHTANSSVVRAPYAAPVGQMGRPYDEKDLTSPDSIRAKLRYAMTLAMSESQDNNGYSWGYGTTERNFGKVPNILVGWTADPLLQVQVNGKTPGGEEMNMVVVHLPAPQNASGNAQVNSSNPFYRDPSLELEDDLGPGAVKPVLPNGMRMGR